MICVVWKIRVVSRNFFYPLNRIYKLECSVKFTRKMGLKGPKNVFLKLDVKEHSNLLIRIQRKKNYGKLLFFFKPQGKVKFCIHV